MTFKPEKRSKTSLQIVLGIATVLLVIALLNCISNPPSVKSDRPAFINVLADIADRLPLPSTNDFFAFVSRQPSISDLPTTSNTNDNSQISNDPREYDDLFMLAHTLDPTFGPDRGFGSWNRVQWLAWLDQREELHANVARRRNVNRKFRLNQKGLNTVVIGTPREITDAFSGELEPFGSENVWSRRRFDTIEFDRDNKGLYRLFHCQSVFIAVKIIDGKPVHLSKINPTQIRSGQANYSRPKNCIPIM